MASNSVVLKGTTYNGVSSLEVPVSGGGTALFTDVSDTTAAASDVAAGKWFYNSLGSFIEGTASGGGGGASNVVTGTFTTVSTHSSHGTASISYTGSGYPIALLVYINNGVYNNTSSGNTDYYNSVNRYDVGAFYMTKSEMNTTPSYTSSGSNNYGTVVAVYKNSTTNPAKFGSASSGSSNTYSNVDAGASSSCVRFKGNGTTLSYYVGNNASSSIGLVPSTEYAYIVIYSS